MVHRYLVEQQPSSPPEPDEDQILELEKKECQINLTTTYRDNYNST